nr:mucin-2-like [Penaeus vannamei]
MRLPFSSLSPTSLSLPRKVQRRNKERLPPTASTNAAAAPVAAAHTSENFIARTIKVNGNALDTATVGPATLLCSTPTTSTGTATIAANPLPLPPLASTATATTTRLHPLPLPTLPPPLPLPPRNPATATTTANPATATTTATPLTTTTTAVPATATTTANPLPYHHCSPRYRYHHRQPATATTTHLHHYRYHHRQPATATPHPTTLPPPPTPLPLPPPPTPLPLPHRQPPTPLPLPQPDTATTTANPDTYHHANPATGSTTAVTATATTTANPATATTTANLATTTPPPPRYHYRYHHRPKFELLRDLEREGGGRADAGGCSGAMGCREQPEPQKLKHIRDAVMTFIPHVRWSDRLYHMRQKYSDQVFAYFPRYTVCIKIHLHFLGCAVTMTSVLKELSISLV